MWWALALGALWAFPTAAAAMVAALGAAAVMAAAQPVVLSFGAGLLVGPRLARRMRGWAA
ncbi:hypothetical protein FNQ90_05260 [Streptomyces alkaliphilus]|uniref:Sulfite exporter TauE/SafE family protein n=2 Tax=Streptomyces alkaliphilus TaxID=1472722 RepID=A0A7W3TBD3_9ACTN|nr:hypothetical protein [Streptomyces alkaliphilus]